MSINEFVKSQVKRIGEAIDFKQRAEKINQQVVEILEKMANDEPIDLSRDRLDPELHAELENMGLIEKARKLGLMRGPRFSVAPKKDTRGTEAAGFEEFDDDDDDNKKDKDNEKEPWELPPIQSPNHVRMENNKRRLEAIDELLQDKMVDGDLIEEYNIEKKRLLAEQETLRSGGGGGGGGGEASTTQQKRRRTDEPPPQEAQHWLAKRNAQRRDETERKDKGHVKFWTGKRKPIEKKTE